MQYKFKVGDKVKIITNGSGVSPSEVGKIVTITEIGIYCEKPGYKIEPKLGNCLDGKYNGFIGENSFVLFEEFQENFFAI